MPGKKSYGLPRVPLRIWMLISEREREREREREDLNALTSPKHYLRWSVHEEASWLQRTSCWRAAMATSPCGRPTAARWRRTPVWATPPWSTFSGMLRRFSASSQDPRWGVEWCSWWSVSARMALLLLEERVQDTGQRSIRSYWSYLPDFRKRLARLWRCVPWLLIIPSWFMLSASLDSSDREDVGWLFSSPSSSERKRMQRWTN